MGTYEHARGREGKVQGMLQLAGKYSSTVAMHFCLLAHALLILSSQLKDRMGAKKASQRSLFNIGTLEVALKRFLFLVLSKLATIFWKSRLQGSESEAQKQKLNP